MKEESISRGLISLNCVVVQPAVLEILGIVAITYMLESTSRYYNESFIP
jgi:hypothetical protein